MKRIGARVRDDIDHSSGSPTIAGRYSVSLNTELMQQIGKRKREIDGAEGVIVIASIQQVIGAICLSSCDSDRRRRGIVLRAGQVTRRSRNGGTGQKHELRRLTAIEWKIDDTPLVDHLGDARCLRLRHLDVRLHFNLLRYETCL